MMNKIIYWIIKIPERMQGYIKNHPFFVTLLLLIIIFVLYFCHFNDGYSSNNGDWGTFGDFVNGISAPFIGVIGIVLTFTIINNQTRESKQSEFKFIFEILLKETDIEVEKINFKKGRNDYNGLAAIEMINQHLEGLIRFHKNNQQNYDLAEVIIESCITAEDDSSHSYDAYLNNIRNCLKVIDIQCNDEHKATYIQLVLSKMNKNQLFFLLYHGIGKREFTDFRLNVEKFGLFKEISDGVSQELKGQFRDSAFN